MTIQKIFSFFSLGLSLVLNFVLMSCSSSQPKATATSSTAPTFSLGRQAIKGLSHTEAIYRSSLVDNIDYDLSIDLSSEKNFSGIVKVHFNLKAPMAATAQPLTLDFEGGQIQSLIVNGKNITTPQYNKFFLKLPNESLNSGVNTVEIAFKHSYSQTGTGLYRFEDPKDKKSYLYTQFEPYDANQLFPCFDQPDLKAQYTLKVKAPKNWIVVSSNLEKSTQSVGPLKQWNFPKSARFSTYIFSLHAGEYKVWKSMAGKIPLRLLARQSLAKYVDPKEWFTLSQQGLNFYGKYFDYPYPFGKYDQIIVPDFNAGAMENVAAVTFSERFISRGQRTLEQKETLASVLLHEMAHMWFGDLVTMKWWDDLWLNESFATYMSTKALKEATAFQRSWQTFAGDDKPWAYTADQYVTTHPIAGAVADTENAFGNFDGITYGKGASVLKQLAYALGEDNFRKGTQLYFKENAFKNAELKDFFASLEKTSQRDLNPWTQDWIRTAGVNSIHSRFDCEDRGRISRLEIRQGASEAHSTIREHKLLIAFLEKTPQGTLRVYKSLPADFKDSMVIGEAKGLPCPAMIFPNQEDYAYIQVKLDPTSLEAVKKDLSRIEDNMLRMMVWDVLWQMVRDGDLSLKNYVDLVMQHAPQEKTLKFYKKFWKRFSASASTRLRYKCICPSKPRPAPIS